MDIFLYIAGMSLFLIIFFTTPLICAAVIWKYSSILSWSAEYYNFYRLFKITWINRIILFASAGLAIGVGIWQLYPTERLWSPLLAPIILSFHPTWIVINLTGLWINKNRLLKSTNNSRLIKSLIFLTIGALSVLPCWFFIFPATAPSPLQSGYFYLPLNFLLGIVFLRSSPGYLPSKSQNLKISFMYILICYFATIGIWTVMPTFSS
jgi:hypothetical protein